MFDESIPYKAMDITLNLGARYAEARLQIDNQYQILIRDGGLEAYGYGVNIGLSVRALVNGSMGFASIDSLDDDSIKEVAERAFKIAKAQGEGSIFLSNTPSIDINYEVRQKKSFEDLDFESKLRYLIEIDNNIKAEEDDVKVLNRFLAVEYTLTRKIIINSDEIKVRSSIPRIMIYTYFVLSHDNRTITRFKTFGGSVGWEIIDVFKPHGAFADEVRRLKKIVKDARKVEPGKYDIILGPETSGLAAHESCGHPFELDRILGREGAQAGESYLKIDDLGREIASEEVSIVDDPTIPNSYGFYLYDDEGVRARPRFLIKEGIINEFLMNRETAYVLGTESNGSARASAYNREPIVRMANTFFKPGNHSFEELIENIKRGIYLKTFGEWNIDDRRYNMRFVGQEAYLIEDSEIKYPLWRPIFEITTPVFYKSIDAVGKDFEMDVATCGKSSPPQGVPVGTGGPSIRIRNVEVSRS